MARIAHCSTNTNRVVDAYELGQEPLPEAELPEGEFYSQEEKWQVIIEEGNVEPYTGCLFYILETNPHGPVSFYPPPVEQEGARQDAQD